MDREVQSQPLSRAQSRMLGPLFSSQPNLSLDTLPNAATSTQESQAAEGSVIAADSNQIESLLHKYSSQSHELTTGLNKFIAERGSLERDLARLEQENRYLDVELMRQAEQVGELRSTSDSLKDKLASEEAQTRTIVELKLLEIQEILGSIESVDKFANDFKKSFSESMSKADDFCKEMKRKLTVFCEESNSANDRCSSDFNQYNSDYNKEIGELKEAAARREREVEERLAMAANRLLEEAKFSKEMDQVLKQIDLETQRRKHLQTTLQQESSLISKLEEDHLVNKKRYESDLSNLKDEVSELTQRKICLDNDVSLSESDLSKLVEKHEELSAKADSLEATLIRKRQEDLMIQQEIEELEREASVLERNKEAKLADLESKEKLATELNSLEVVVSELETRCRELAKAKEAASLETSRQALVEEEENLQRVRGEHQRAAIAVQQAQEELADKTNQKELLTQERLCLEKKLEESASKLSEAGRSKELQDFRRTKEGLSGEIESLKRVIEERSRLLSYLKQLRTLQQQEYKDMCEEACNVSSDGSSTDDSLLDNFVDIHEEMERMGVKDLDERMRRVMADIQSNVKTAEDARESHRNQTENLQSIHQLVIREMDKEAEEHRKYCSDRISELESETRLVQGRKALLMEDVSAKRRDLEAKLPSLASSLQTSLSLYEKIAGYYMMACNERSSGNSSIHWDNTKEVLGDLLSLPLQKLAQLKGIPFIDVASATPKTYLEVINQARMILNEIISQQEGKPVEYTCKKLLKMRKALYCEIRVPDSPASMRLNDTYFSTSTED